MSTETIRKTVAAIIQEINKFFLAPFSEGRVTIPLMLASNDSNAILEALNSHYETVFPVEDLHIFRGGLEARCLEIKKRVLVYEAAANLTSPLRLRGDTALMFFVDEEFEYYESRFLKKTMNNCLVTAKHFGFAGTILKHG